MELSSRWSTVQDQEHQVIKGKSYTWLFAGPNVQIDMSKKEIIFGKLVLPDTKLPLAPRAFFVFYFREVRLWFSLRGRRLTLCLKFN